MPRRKVEVFSLSFLDCISCGFGAVILFYTIISAQSGQERIRRTDDLAAEVSRLEIEVLEGTKNLVVLRNTLEKTTSETASAAERARRFVQEIQERREQSSVFDKETLARREHIEKLKADVRSLEEESRRLSARAGEDDLPSATGKLRGGPRRYINGLNLRGKRILILLDRSASMMHDDVVEILRLRNTAPETRRRTEKWRRAVRIVDWLSTQLPGESSYQLYAFNVNSKAVLGETAGKWLRADDRATRGRLRDAVRELVPEEGTSLVNALAALKDLKPAPDQIVLITDGLPTQGSTPPGFAKYISVRDRAKLFDAATRDLPAKTPIDVVLLPMKGDLPATHRYWMVARKSGGSFVMPSRDWP
ncbi:MAG: VWA domain-containing protein [Steroidobacteraceae bacterium]